MTLPTVPRADKASEACGVTAASSGCCKTFEIIWKRAINRGSPGF